jgi:DNA-binding NarL/FixJ family response regulator
MGQGLSADAHGEPDVDERLRRAAAVWQLTSRQRDVLRPLVEGASNKEIARDLTCAENTVELHVTRLFAKAGVASRGRLMARFWSQL